MPEMTSVGKAVMAAFEDGRDINLHRYPIRLEIAEMDAWYLLDVDKIVNHIDVRY